MSVDISPCAPSRSAPVSAWMAAARLNGRYAGPDSIEIPDADAVVGEVLDTSTQLPDTRP